MKIMLLFLNIRGQKIKNTHGMKIANIIVSLLFYYGKERCFMAEIIAPSQQEESKERIKEDYAVEKVPNSYRMGWLGITNVTLGVATAMVFMPQLWLGL